MASLTTYAHRVHDVRFVRATLAGSARIGRLLERRRLTTLWTLAVAGAVLPPIADGLGGTADKPQVLFTIIASVLVVVYSWFALLGANYDTAIRKRDMLRQARHWYADTKTGMRSNVWQDKLFAVSDGLAAVGTFAIALASLAALIGVTTGWFGAAALNQTRLFGGLLVFLAAVSLLGARNKERTEREIEQRWMDRDRLSYDHLA